MIRFVTTINKTRLSTTTTRLTVVLSRRPQQEEIRRCYQVHAESSPFPNKQIRGFHSSVKTRSSNYDSTVSSKPTTSSSSPVRDPGLAITSVLSDPKNIAGPVGIPSRGDQLQRLMQSSSSSSSANEGDSLVYDVLVVGGGATGTGIALDAASRGLTVACVERGDFSSETSSRSTKLIWAGIRYIGTATAALLSTNLLKHPVRTLETFWGEMKMVFHCHQERKFMTETQRHLCHWIPIAVPFTSWHVSPPPMGHPLYGFFPLLAPFVFKFYDALSYFTCPPSYIMTKKQVEEKFPQLQTDNLKYCAVFYEAQHNDARTCLAIAMSAAMHGAHIANYVEMTRLILDEDSKHVSGAVCTDRMTGKQFTIGAKHVVLAGGPFTNEMLGTDGQDRSKALPAVQGVAGTHIVVPGHAVPKDMGLLDFNTSDGRFLFLLPWLNHTLIGTTDVAGTAAQTSPHPPEKEISWLLQEGQKYLKKSEITLRRDLVLSAWRGWRPLAMDPNDGSSTSRDHVISQYSNNAFFNGLWYVAGGKWTTWREMAEDMVDRLLPGSHCKTLQIVLYGGEGYSERLVQDVLKKYPVMDKEVAKHLVDTYGGRVWEVCSCGNGDDGKGKLNRLVDGFPYLQAEVSFACREYACTVEDVLSRRTRLAFLNKHAAMQALPVVADIMAHELGWTLAVKQKQMEAAAAYIDLYSGPEEEEVEDEEKKKQVAAVA